ncbi:MAG: hypothetical protein IDH49_09860 [Gammaproteobacteria bacterium]|nr:hypothetical protein [Gammaproteobacteria bacterium]
MDKTIFAREARTVEFVARHLWHFIRPLVKTHLSPRCRHCVLPDTASPLDETGLCKECREYSTTAPTGTAKHAQPHDSVTDPIDDILRSYTQSSKGPYDAILLFSGGKDSTYLLHRLVTDYPRLRILTMLVDNGFLSPFAVENANRVLRRFDVDHITVRPQPSFVKKAFRYALTNLDKQTGYSIVDQFDGHITFDTAKNLAARQDIPLVICGVSRVQLENVFGPIGFEFPPEQEQAPLTTHAGIPLREVFSEDEMQHWFDGSCFPEERVPRFLFPYYVWDPSEEFILTEVSRLGLIDSRQSSPLLTNNTLIPVIGMAEVARFGYSSFEVEFARMVREGKSERGYWLNLFEMLEYSTKTGHFINKTVTDTLAQLGLTKKDIGVG